MLVIIINSSSSIGKMVKKYNTVLLSDWMMDKWNMAVN